MKSQNPQIAKIKAKQALTPNQLSYYTNPAHKAQIRAMATEYFAKLESDPRFIANNAKPVELSPVMKKAFAKAGV